MLNVLFIICLLVIWFFRPAGGGLWESDMGFSQIAEWYGIANHRE